MNKISDEVIYEIYHILNCVHNFADHSSFDFFLFFLLKGFWSFVISGGS